MKLIVGLGNPGKEYAGHRHNVGFMAVDHIHDEWRGNPWRKKFQAEIAEVSVGDTRCLLVKPMTYMNESGRAVAEAMRFYKIQLPDVVIIHDEIDLAPGKFRMKTGGGTGGHNGLKSMTAMIKDGYRRLRIGVGHPGRKEMVPGYVLRDFAKADADWLEPMLDAFAREAPSLAAGDDAGFANKVHQRLGRGPAKPAAKSPPAPAAASAAQPKSPLAPPAAAPATTGPFAALKGLFRK